MSDVDCIVVGAGVVGLAVAAQLAEGGRSVMVIEAEEIFGSGTSSRNSEVIHAGIYYGAGTLKAELCIRGREALYRYAAERNIPHARTGKLIVATSEAEVSKLCSIREHARRCGVEDLLLMSGAEATSLEPALACVAALHSPSTGIVDSHALMQNLLGDLETAGGEIVFNTAVEGGVIDGNLVRLSTRDRATGEAFEISTSLLVNAAGLEAGRLAASLEGFPREHLPPVVFAKGNYFAAPGRSPFSRLIYPVPVDGGLGVHLTFDLGGQMRFGPDVEWIDAIDFTVDPARSASFYAEIRRYWPALADGALTPAYCGIRPKLSGPGAAAADFRIDGPARHGLGNVVNLFGIESPGLTSSLAIAERVANEIVRPA